MNRERQPTLNSTSFEMYASICRRCKYEDGDCATILCPRCGLPTVWEPTQRSGDFFDKRTAVWVPQASLRMRLRAEGTREAWFPAADPRPATIPSPPPQAGPMFELLTPLLTARPVSRWWTERWVFVLFLEMLTLATTLIALGAYLRT